MRSIAITAAQVIGAPHASFPVLVAVSAAWLRTTQNGGDVASDRGFDILFSADADGAQPLAHELDAYDGATGDLTAWVNLPALTATTVFYVRYGNPAITTSRENPTAVWSNGYAAVWHQAADLRDSTGHTAASDHGTADAAGKIARARSFNGSTSYIDYGSSAPVDNVFATGGTAEAWIFPNTFGQSSRGRMFEKGDATVTTTTAGWTLSVDNYNVSSSVLFGHQASTSAGFWNSQAGVIALGAWTHVAVAYDQSSGANVPAFYVNGAPVSYSTLFTMQGTPTSDDAYDLTVGTRLADDRTFDGIEDEMRLSNVARSAGWIETEYLNQSAPSSFYTVGPDLQ